MSAVLLLGVALAGGAGAVSRFIVDGSLSARRPAVFPYPTLLINVSGSLLLGILTGFSLFHGADPAWRAVVGAGFCGGFTTFSTASLASVRLAQAHQPGWAVANALGTWALCVAAAALGLSLARL